MASRSSCVSRNGGWRTGSRTGWSRDTSGSDHPTTFTLDVDHKRARREAHAVSRSDLYADASQDQLAIQTVRAWLLVGSAASRNINAALHHHLLPHRKRTYSRYALSDICVQCVIAVDVLLQRVVRRNRWAHGALESSVKSIFPARDFAA